MRDTNEGRDSPDWCGTAFRLTLASTDVHAPCFFGVQIQEEIRGGFDSLVVGGSLHPVLIMPELIKHLKPSSPFAVYSQFAEPLLETMEALIKADECLDMSIAETWMREYQVLPGRTHPNMHMTAASGFLLMGCKVVRKVDKPLPVPNKPKRGEEGYEGGGAEKKQKIGEGQ